MTHGFEEKSLLEVGLLVHTQIYNSSWLLPTIVGSGYTEHAVLKSNYWRQAENKTAS